MFNIYGFDVVQLIYCMNETLVTSAVHGTAVIIVLPVISSSVNVNPPIHVQSTFVACFDCSSQFVELTITQFCGLTYIMSSCAVDQEEVNLHECLELITRLSRHAGKVKLPRGWAEFAMHITGPQSFNNYYYSSLTFA